MATDVTMPRLSDSMEEGTVLKWLIEEGGEVKRGEPLVEIETDKANMTYDADTDGVLVEVVAQEGDTLAIGEVIARIGDPGEVKGDGKPSAEEDEKAEEEEKAEDEEAEPERAQPEAAEEAEAAEEKAGAAAAAGEEKAEAGEEKAAEPEAEKEEAAARAEAGTATRERKPEGADGDGRVVARDQMTLSLVCDHRILYGADGAMFLARVKELLEQPLSLAL